MAAILLAIVVALVARLSTSQIGGQTGDVLGALEQVSEIVILLVALRCVPSPLAGEGSPDRR